MATVQGGSVARNGGQERQKLAPAQPLAKHNSARAVGPVQLKDVLGEIQSDGAYLVHGCLLKWPATPSLWHADAAGGVHTCTLGRRLVATSCKLARRASSLGATSVHTVP